MSGRKEAHHPHPGAYDGCNLQDRTYESTAAQRDELREAINNYDRVAVIRYPDGRLSLIDYQYTAHYHLDWKSNKVVCELEEEEPVA
jgi:hypothetical protein